MPFQDLYQGASYQWDQTGADIDFTPETPFGDEDWLDFISQSGLDITQYTPEDVLGDPFSGVQTTYWPEGSITGGAGLGLEGDVSYGEATGYDIAGWLAGAGGLENQFIWGESITGQFAEEFGQAFEQAEWGSAGDPFSYAGQVAFLEEQYGTQEAALWSQYSAWQEGAAGLLEDQFTNIYQAYIGAEDEILANKAAGLQSVYSQRSAAERGALESLLQSRRAGGRAGFGETGRYGTAMDIAETKLGGYTTGAFDITQMTSSALETLSSESQFSTEAAWQEFALGQSGQLESISSQLEMMQATYGAQMEGIYQDWVGQIMDIAGQQDFTGYEEFGFDMGMDDDTGEDPCAGMWCPPGQVLTTNPQTGECSCETPDPPGPGAPGEAIVCPPGQIATPAGECVEGGSDISG